MARVTVNLHGEIAERIFTDRVFLKGNTVKEIFKQLENLYPELVNDIRFRRVVCIINGRNIETLNRENTKLEDFDLVDITLKGSLIDFSHRMAADNKSEC
jgi:molybdopterin synthase sulfur carrier subunit